MSADLEARVKSLEDTLQRITQALIAIPQKQEPPAATPSPFKHVSVPQKLPAQLANENTEKKTAKPPVDIRTLKDGMKSVTVSAKIVEKGEPREVRTTQGPVDTATVVIADESGSIKLVLWGEQIDTVNVADDVTVENGYVSSFKGEIQLNVGKYGKLTVGAPPQ
jgi:replication factor A1